MGLISSKSERPATGRINNEQNTSNLNGQQSEMSTDLNNSNNKFHTPDRTREQRVSQGSARPEHSVSETIRIHRLNSANAILDSPVGSCDTDTAVDTEQSLTRKYQQLNIRRRRSLRTESASGEGLHPVTRKQVFKKVVHDDKVAYVILCPLLMGGLKGRTIDADSGLKSLVANNNEPDDRFIKKSRRLSDSSIKDLREERSHHAKFMLDILAKHTTAQIDFNISFEICEEITFDDLLSLYLPLSTVLRRDNGGWRAYKVERVEVGPRLDLDTMLVHCYYLDFDKTGKWLVPQLETFSIAPFYSAQSIGALDLIPDWYIERSCSGLRDKLIERGRKYCEFRGRAYHREYKGDVWQSNSEKNSLRVVIDYATGSKNVDDLTIPHSKGRSCSVCLGETLDLGPYCKGMPHDLDVCIRDSRSAMVVEDCGPDDENVLLFCPPKIRAFSLRYKEWRMVQVMDLSPVRYEENAWQQVRMDNEHKTFLDSVVSTYFSKRNGIYDDNVRRSSYDPNEDTGSFSSKFFKSRRRGINILLQGPPGTGKTFTAECLAETHGVPLYLSTCGEMGTEPRELEDQLRETFLRAANWGAILLLDEVDFFLRAQPGQRDVNDLKRAALISIFLNQLDCSEALVFLTASRPARPDMNFESRINLPLKLPDLKFSDQKEIWVSLIKDLNLPEPEYKALEDFVCNERSLWRLNDGAHRNMNGRQIKSCVRAAVALAEREQEDGNNGSIRTALNLTDSHIRRILTFGKNFRDSFDTRPRVDRNFLDIETKEGKDSTAR